MTPFGVILIGWKKTAMQRSDLVKKHKPVNSHLVEEGIVRWQIKEDQEEIKFPLGYCSFCCHLNFQENNHKWFPSSKKN